MLKTRIAREEILRRLRHTVEAGKPILGAGCSAGIIAKCAELGGADLIIVYSTGKSRLMGLPTSRLGDSNAITLAMAEEILNVVRDTPVIGGVEATDPTRLDLNRLLRRFIEAGYSGIINFPTIGIFTDYRRMRDKVGLGFSREVEMVRLARQLGIFTMAYVFSPADAEQMAQAGVDCMVAHAGPTAGGLVGVPTETSLETAALGVQRICEATKRLNPSIICLAHGGPFATPEDTAYLYQHTEAVGYVAASAIERLPIEKAVRETAERFKNVTIGKEQEG
ncbi:MAG: phosphoenolpyruvate hydrolase family protein [Chloroflexi bacterium]|nr:phosphoenolpyruvate hydrolase family protein [Chloroflexota bacterium]MCL5075412.1 phosphoenolpyruvate hydrolase family protein [Chloroflexota bacterium]